MIKIKNRQSLKLRKKRNIIIGEAIPSKSLCSMSKDAIVVVNRVNISARLVACEIKGGYKNDEVEMILRRAIRDFHHQDLKSRKASIGAVMTVSDVMKVFENPETLHDNTFYAVKSN